MTEQLDVSKPAKAQYAMRFGPRTYTDSQSAFIGEVVSKRQDLTDAPLLLGDAVIADHSDEVGEAANAISFTVS